jgi:hypothetical protein
MPTQTASTAATAALALVWGIRSPSTHIQQLFLFENKAPVDVQIQIHIDVLYSVVPRRSFN